MLKHRDAEMIGIMHQNQGVNLGGFPLLREFVVSKCVKKANLSLV